MPLGPIAETVVFTGESAATGRTPLSVVGAGESSPSAYPDEWRRTLSEAALGIAGNMSPTSSGGIKYNRGRHVTGFPVFSWTYWATYGWALAFSHARDISMPPNDPALPDGASYWEWDYDTWVITAATLNTTFTGNLVGLVNGSPATLTVDSGKLAVHHGTGVVWGEFGDTADQWAGTWGDEIAAHSINGTPGDEVTTHTPIDMELLETTQKGWTPPGRVAFALGVDLGDPRFPSQFLNDIPGTAEASINLSGGIIATVTYQIACGYRFWYDVLPEPPVEPAVAVTRLWPRDDALGSMGSAPRLYPPPRRGRIFGGQN